jgi:hypothetical protein
VWSGGLFQRHYAWHGTMILRRQDMNAEKHFLAGTQVEADQSKLDPATN